MYSSTVTRGSYDIVTSVGSGLSRNANVFIIQLMPKASCSHSHKHLETSYAVCKFRVWVSSVIQAEYVGKLQRIIDTSETRSYSYYGL